MTFGLKIVLVIIFGIMFLSAFIGSLKSKHFFKSVFFTALQGLGALCAVNMTAALTGVILPVNYLTLSVGGFMGLPGIILLLCTNILFRYF